MTGASESTALATAADALRLAADALDAAAAASRQAARDAAHLPSGLVSIDVATQALGVSRTFLYGAMDRGEIATRKIGRRRLVPVAELARLAGANRTTGDRRAADGR